LARFTDAFDDEVISQALRDYDSTPLPAGEKGFAAFAGVSALEVISQGRAITDLGTPLAVLHAHTLHRNITTVQAWCDARDVLYAPHVKTTMSPLIIASQLRAGAWGMTVATVTQAAALASVGVRRIIVANQVVDPVDIAVLQRLRRSDSTLAVYCYVDSREGVNELHDAMRHQPENTEPLPVLVELGMAGGRAGVRTDTDAEDVSRHVHASSSLRLAGVAGFEGVLGSDRSSDARGRVVEYLTELVRVSQLVRSVAGAEADPAWICSAGGSLYLDLVVEVLGAPGLDHTIVVRSGGVVTYDDSYLGAHPLDFDGMTLSSALELRASVLSVPEPGLAILGLGKRDAGGDIELPNPRAVLADHGPVEIADHWLSAMNDQHAYLRPPAGALLHPSVVVGARVSLGIAHPCTTFDKWRRIPLADDADRLVGIATTLF